MVNYYPEQIKENKSFINNSKFLPNIDIGLCVKIENSNKIFQVVGLNNKRSICWIRELPLNFETHKTFALSMSKIITQTICPFNKRNEKPI